MTRFMVITSLPAFAAQAGFEAFVSDLNHPEGIDENNPEGQPLAISWHMNLEDAERTCRALTQQEDFRSTVLGKLLEDLRVDPCQRTAEMVATALNVKRHYSMIE